jgi:hypothetical protein
MVNLQYKCTTRTRQPMTYDGESTCVFQIAKTFFFRFLGMGPQHWRRTAWQLLGSLPDDFFFKVSSLVHVPYKRHCVEYF